MFKLNNGKSVKVEDARTSLKDSAQVILEAKATERSASVAIGRELQKVKDSGMAFVLLTTDQKKATKKGKRSQLAFSVFCDGVDINESARSRYMAHAKVVDGLIANGVKDAEEVSAHLGRALVKAAKAATATKKAEGAKAKKAKTTPTDILATLEAEGIKATADSVRDRFVEPKALPKARAGKTTESEGIKSEGQLITAILAFADGDAPRNFDGQTVEDIVRAADIVSGWAADAVALQESNKAA